MMTLCLKRLISDLTMSEEPELTNLAFWFNLLQAVYTNTKFSSAMSLWIKIHLLAH